MLEEKAKQITDQLALLKGFAPAGTDTGKAILAFIDRKLCTGCGRCISSCQTAALFLLDGTAAVDMEKCTGCGICVQECPLGAIALKSESRFHNGNN
ncbi:4Fe-4S dicluster domain-containing protein [candidate division KSB1 bacterium]|nr:4Fe-4S dicluster domain-containing protein [candidate division KSB1 bacterium]